MERVHNIKAGICIAYDWELLKNSIPRIYDDAHIICLSKDINNISWSGKQYEFNTDAFNAFIKSIDSDNKIILYEDNFYLPELSPIENDNRQRNLMAKKMGEGGWHIQIDADEYFIDFKRFVQYLLEFNSNPQPKQKPINIQVNLIPILKQLQQGYIIAENELNKYENVPIATNVPFYNAARRNGHFNHLSPFFMIHETWARSEDEIWNKINSWGHSEDFNKQSFFNLWKALDENNIKHIHNFHPIVGNVWEKLAFVKGNTIDEIISTIQAQIIPIKKKDLFIKNNRNIQRIVSIINKI